MNNRELPKGFRLDLDASNENSTQRRATVGLEVIQWQHLDVQRHALNLIDLLQGAHNLFDRIIRSLMGDDDEQLPIGGLALL